MRNIFTLLASLLFSFNLFANSEDYLNKTFVLISNYNAVNCNGAGNPTTGNSLLEQGFLLKVNGIIGSNFIVSLSSEFTGGNTVEQTAYNLRYYKNANNEYLYFLVDTIAFHRIRKQPKVLTTFTVGIPTIPVKMRFGNGGTGDDPRFFRFEGNVSLGLSGGVKFSYGNKKQYGTNVVLGFTVASVQVDSTTTKGKVNANTSAASFSPHLGLVFDFNKFQFGLYSGIDFLYGSPNKEWVYRNQPWLGLGIGYSLFNVGETDKKKIIGSEQMKL